MNVRAHWAAAVLALALAVAGCTGDDGSNGSSDAGKDEDIVYLLPEEVPNGWTLSIATERTNPVPDYTVSWSPIGIAGQDRAEAVAAPDEGPGLWINVGARFYAQNSGSSAADAAGAPMNRDGDLLSLKFVMAGSPVSVGGREVTEDDLRGFAMSLQQHEHYEWREALGERLSVDRG